MNNKQNSKRKPCAAVKPEEYNSTAQGQIEYINAQFMQYVARISQRKIK